MNILIRASGVSGHLSPAWLPVPNNDGVWVYELQSDSTEGLAEEIFQISDEIRITAKQSDRLILHFGKYNDVESLDLNWKHYRPTVRARCVLSLETARP